MIKLFYLKHFKFKMEIKERFLNKNKLINSMHWLSFSIQNLKCTFKSK